MRITLLTTIFIVITALSFPIGNTPAKKNLSLKERLISETELIYDAMNLDGGGSSALWSRKYGVVSHPCDNRKYDHEGERKVSSTIVVKTKK